MNTRCREKGVKGIIPQNLAVPARFELAAASIVPMSPPFQAGKYDAKPLVRRKTPNMRLADFAYVCLILFVAFELIPMGDHDASIDVVGQPVLIFRFPGIIEREIHEPIGGRLAADHLTQAGALVAPLEVARRAIDCAEGQPAPERSAMTGEVE